MLMAVTETMDIMKTSDYSRLKRPFVKCDNKIEIVIIELISAVFEEKKGI